MKIQNFVILVKKNLKIKMLMTKKYFNVKEYCHYTGEYRGAAHSICNLKFSLRKEILVAFHNKSNYDYCFNIKQPGEECEGQLTCLGEFY